MLLCIHSKADQMTSSCTPAAAVPPATNPADASAQTTFALVTCCFDGGAALAEETDSCSCAKTSCHRPLAASSGCSEAGAVGCCCSRHRHRMGCCCAVCRRACLAHRCCSVCCSIPDYGCVSGRQPVAAAAAAAGCRTCCDHGTCPCSAISPHSHVRNDPALRTGSSAGLDRSLAAAGPVYVAEPRSRGSCSHTRSCHP